MIVDRLTACTVLLAISATAFAKEDITTKKNLRSLSIKNSTDVLTVAPPVSQALSAAADGGDGDSLDANLFEGDIVPTYEGIMENYGEEAVKKLQEAGILSTTETSGNYTRSRGLGTDPQFLWNTRVNGVVQVPYAFVSGHFTTSEESDIVSWISQMAQESGVVNFIPRSSQPNYVRFLDGGNVCSSFVGMQGGSQDLKLGRPDCVHSGIAQHEFLHALGFWHEQSRPDRDSFVSINFNNIMPGQEHNFMKQTSINSLGSAYDYGSIMHYGSTFFSSNGQPTIVPLQPGVIIGQRDDPSTSDIIQLRLLYQCQSGPRSLGEYNANLCTSDCQCWEGASGCGTNDNACQGNLMCINNMCTFDDNGCQDDPIGWYDSDGPVYDCDWYGIGTRCADHGDDFENFGATANEACCVCGGGGGSSGCQDDPIGWYDSDGPVYDCDWYGIGTRCADHGDDFENFGATANEACCVCGGGGGSSGCQDDPIGWYDSDGPVYDCDWYGNWKQMRRSR